MLKIVILEDDERRQAAMQECLKDRFHQYESVFFDDATKACTYLESNLDKALVISLDHDLELKPQRNGKAVDVGTGRLVAEFLATRSPSCPIVIATTNSAAGDGMEFLLRDSQWETYRVYPYGDLEWIANQWFRTMRNAIVQSARPRTTA